MVLHRRKPGAAGFARCYQFTNCCWLSEDAPSQSADSTGDRTSPEGDDMIIALYLDEERPEWSLFDQPVAEAE